MDAQSENPQNANLYAVLARGDRKIKAAQRKAIILVGLTRNGKSTTFNWILRNPMVGQGDILDTHYTLVVENDASAAEVGNLYSSVTLAPNVYVEYEKGVSLIDVAGYQDTRNFVGVIGVSYFLKALFQRVREVKFIIVFDQNKFKQNNGSGFIRTFIGFPNMFHYKDMSGEIKSRLKDSISVVITKSKSSQQHFSYLDAIIKKIENPKFKVNNRDEIIDLVTSIRSSAIIQPFFVAKDNCNPEECSFVTNFTNNKGWKFFDLDQAERIMGKSPISLPFEKDFLSLDESEKNAFTNVIERKVESYIGFSQILERVIGNFTQNWREFLEVWKNEGRAIPNHFHMKPTFDKIREYVQANDVYNSKQQIEIKLRVNYEPMTLIKSIKQLLSIYDHVIKIGTSENFEDFIGAMDLFDNQFSALIQCLRGFASDNVDQELLQRLKFILRRGFREFTKLYQLKPEYIHDAKQRLRDNCNIAFDIKKEQLIKLFISTFTSDLLVKLFPNLTLLTEYEQFFRVYQQDYQIYQSPIFFSQRRSYIQMAKADLLFSSGQKVKALKFFIKALKSLNDIGVCIVQDEEIDSNVKENQLNSLSMNKTKVIRKIVNILKVLPQNQNVNYKKYALWLCQHHKMIDDTFLIFQSMIDSSSNNLQKLKIYADYAQYCATWGRLEKGIEQLQKKLTLEEQNFEEYSRTFTAMNKMMSSRQEYTRNFLVLTSETKRLPEVDAELNQQLAEIETLGLL